MRCTYSWYELQGGMSNEMYNTIARVTDGIYEGIRTSWVYNTVFCYFNDLIYNIKLHKMQALIY